MPTSYVTPTIKNPVANEERKPAKPGHLVKPSLRSVEPELVANLAGSSYKPNHVSQTQPSKGSRQMAQSPQSGSGSRQNASLNRTFSLASADLLKATTGSDTTHRRYETLPKPGAAESHAGKNVEGQFPPLPLVADSPAAAKERPQSAMAVGSFQSVDARCRQLDVRRLSLAPPKDDRLLFSPPFSCSSTTSYDDDRNSLPQERVNAGSEQQHGSLPQYAASKMKPRSASRSGEVATVTPVRVVSSNVEGNHPQGPGSSDTYITKCLTPSPEDKTLAETKRGGGSKNPPASPVPPSDQQTVWYEYGCV